MKNDLFPEHALLLEAVLTELVRLSLPEGKPLPAGVGMKGLKASFYTLILYNAFKQTQYPARQMQARCELSSFLRCIIRPAPLPELAEAIVQRALFRIQEQIDDCTSPVTFLAFARTQLDQACINVTRDAAGGAGSKNGISPLISNPMSSTISNDAWLEYERFLETMTHTFTKRDREKTYHLVQTLMNDYQWALLEVDTLVDLTGVNLTRLQKQPTKNAVRNMYIPILYSAFRQNEYPGWQEKAYRELARFLHRTTLKRGWTPVDEVVQEALSKTFEKVEQTRRPVTFLAFAYYKLWEARNMINKSEPDIPPMPDGDRPVESLDRCLMEALGRLAKVNPNQAQAVLLHYLAAEIKNDKEIAARLGLKASSIPNLRKRGLAWLRNDDQLRDCLDMYISKIDWF